MSYLLQLARVAPPPPLLLETGLQIGLVSVDRSKPASQALHLPSAAYPQHFVGKEVPYCVFISVCEVATHIPAFLAVSYLKRTFPILHYLHRSTPFVSAVLH